MLYVDGGGAVNVMIRRKLSSKGGLPMQQDYFQRSFPSLASSAVLAVAILTGCGQKWSETETGMVRTVTNRGGRTLGYSNASGISLLAADRLAFKDLNRNGTLDSYEDWRLPSEERARDLASKMTVDQIAGLMLYSPHQAIPGTPGPFGTPTYDGKPFGASDANTWDLSDGQKKFLTRDGVRHVLITTVESPEVAARWNNAMQALVEGIGLGIPVNTSSDPRHRARADAVFNAGAGGRISRWPDAIGLAATFDPNLVLRFGEIASNEYRALGIATALSPQADIATEPRWSRISGTFGEDPDLATDMARAYVDGFQSSTADTAIEGGWGFRSVNAMAKHWPGGGPGEAGRDSHFSYGKYAVYPGGNLGLHLLPFREGAFALTGGTGAASAIMPSYRISYAQDPVHGENVGNAFSQHMIGDLLRGEFGYDGVVCTDWNVTRDYAGVGRFGGIPWGVEELTEVEKHYRALMAGVDQFGGNDNAGPLLAAYEMGVQEHGEQFMRDRFETSAVRLLRNIFRTGLFDNPYLDVEETVASVGKPEYMAAGHEAQIKSLVLVKNQGNTLPLPQDARVYVPQRHVPTMHTFFGLGPVIPAHSEDPLDRETAGNYFTLTDSADEADVGLVVIESPESGVGYAASDVAEGLNGYRPISLQYGPYTATHARATSIAGGDPLEASTNRSYRGKSVTTSNVTDLEAVLDVRRQMKGRPVIVVLRMSRPTIVSEFEPSVDAILVSFGVQDEAVLAVLSGKAEPSGLLPLQMPADMQTVEEQSEDTPHDMRPHVDTSGNAYDFGFGLDWKGVIRDERVRRYVTQGRETATNR